MPTASPEVASCVFNAPAASGAIVPQCVAVVGIGGDYARYLLDVHGVLSDVRTLLIFVLVMGTLLGALTAFRLTFGR